MIITTEMLWTKAILDQLKKQKEEDTYNRNIASPGMSLDEYAFHNPEVLGKIVYKIMGEYHNNLDDAHKAVS